MIDIRRAEPKDIPFIIEFQKKMAFETGNNYFGLRLYVEMNNTLAQEVYIKVGMDGNHYKMYEWVKE